MCIPLWSQFTHLIMATSSVNTQHVTKHWFHKHEFSAFQWPLQSPHLNPVDHFWDIETQHECAASNLQQLCDAIMSETTHLRSEWRSWY